MKYIINKILKITQDPIDNLKYSTYLETLNIFTDFLKLKQNGKDLKGYIVITLEFIPILPLLITIYILSIIHKYSPSFKI